MSTTESSLHRFIHAVLPAFLLAASVGQIYAFTNVSDAIAEAIGGVSKNSVQFAFSLGIFFLGMGAAFFGRIVERNIRLSTIVGTALFLGGLLVTALGVRVRSLALVYAGYGVLLGMGTGVIYISPVKTMMLWFPNAKAIAAAFPIISFGLGSTFSTLFYKGVFGLRGFEQAGAAGCFVAYAAVYAVPMILSCVLLRKPESAAKADAAHAAAGTFSYGNLLRTAHFRHSWLFMFLNISCGLCLIPLAKQTMKGDLVGYPEALVTAIVALCGLFNGGGRFVFAWWSDRMRRRTDILPCILLISFGVMALAYAPVTVGLALLVINACYGAGFSVIPAILSDHYGMSDISKIHGAVLSAWGVAGLVGNQAALLVSDKLGFGYYGVVTMLVVFYGVNLLNVLVLRRLHKSVEAA